MPKDLAIGWRGSEQVAFTGAVQPFSNLLTKHNQKGSQI